MTKLRICLVVAVATTILAGSALTSQDRAWAGSFNREMPRMGHGHGHGGGGFRHHGGGGRWGQFGTGLAVGIGMELIGEAIAAQNQPPPPPAPVEREHIRIHRDAKKQGWTKKNERRHACYVADEYQKLWLDAQAIEKRMTDLKVDGDTVGKQHQEVGRRLQDWQDAKAKC